MRLPPWPSGTAAMPIAFACSSLFSATARDEPRERVNSFPVPAPAGIQLRYTGERLSQRDADVFLHLLAGASAVPLGQPARFTAHCLLRDLGWDASSRGYVRLRDSIAKLEASAIECEWTAGPGRRPGYAGSLIDAFCCKDGVSGRRPREWAISLEPKLIRLFDDSACALVNLRARRLLGNHELAKWLYSYLAAHGGNEGGMRAAKLRELCGSRAKTLFGFRRTLRLALDLLVSRKLVERCAIDPDRDLVSFGRLPASGGRPWRIEQPARPAAVGAASSR